MNISRSLIILAASSIWCIHAKAETTSPELNPVPIEKHITEINTGILGKTGTIIRIPREDNRGDFLWEYLFLYPADDITDPESRNALANKYMAQFGEQTTSGPVFFISEALDQDGCVLQLPAFFQTKNSNPLDTYLVFSQRIKGDKESEILKLTLYQYEKNTNHNPGFPNFYFSVIGQDQINLNKVQICSVSFVVDKMKKSLEKIAK